VSAADLSAVAATLTRELSARYSSTVVGPDHVAAVVARGLLRALSAAIPGAGAVVDAILARADHTSVTIPLLAGGCLVVLAPQHTADALVRCEVVAHEHQHAAVIARDADLDVIVDYLGSGELRGLREAEAYAVGLWTRYLLTGQVPTLDGARASLASDAYHLDDGDQATALSTLESHVDTIRAGAVPPLSVCRAVLEVLQQHHPDAIVPPEHGVPA
jgi:hypothetical protein